MREKIIDTALIVTLILVAFGITWTLLTLNRGEERSPNPVPETERTETQGRGTTIEPLPLGGEEQEEEPNELALPDEPEASEATDEQEENDEAAQQAAVAEPEPVPAGPVQLERIGFSFATGGAGACGIVLEPWRHVAVSRELLAAYGCGAQVTISLDDETAGRSEFEAIVADTMNPIHSRTVNIYVGEDEPALQYGVTDGVLRP